MSAQNMDFHTSNKEVIFLQSARACEYRHVCELTTCTHVWMLEREAQDNPYDNRLPLMGGVVAKAYIFVSSPLLLKD